MKIVTFRRESDNFDDIYNDPVIKKCFRQKMKWKNFLRITVEDEKVLSYIELKFGEAIVDKIVPDRSPIPNVDYSPKR